MRVTAWVETEVEVDISVADAMAELCNLPVIERKAHLVSVVNRCVSALRNCPDSLLAELGEQSRRIVADALRAQALRYDPTDAAAAGSEEGGHG